MGQEASNDIVRAAGMMVSIRASAALCMIGIDVLEVLEQFLYSWGYQLAGLGLGCNPATRKLLIKTARVDGLRFHINLNLAKDLRGRVLCGAWHYLGGCIGRE